jgi:glycerol-3-phosphate dehydrogenase (NAD(P)+)
MKHHVAVIGAGAWGTALANAAALAGQTVTLWGRDQAHIREMQKSRRNERRLPGVVLHPEVHPEPDLTQALHKADALLLVVPAQQTIAMITLLQPQLPAALPIILCAKGLDRATGRFLSDLISDKLIGHPVMILSGPSFAEDVGRGLPTAVVLACKDAHLARDWAHYLSSPRFRLYHSSDLRGVEIGGAAKNVLAVAAGIVAGRGLGESARAALTARGFAELSRFAEAWGGAAETLMGLSGLGDLVLTSGSAKSRNFAFGEALGRGVPLDEAMDGKLAEGAFTAPVLVAMAREKQIEMPIAEAVEAVLSGQETIDAMIELLMTRPIRAE